MALLSGIGAEQGKGWKYPAPGSCPCDGACAKCSANFGLGAIRLDEQPDLDELGVVRQAMVSVDEQDEDPSRDESSWTGDFSDPVSWRGASSNYPALGIDVYFAAGPRSGTEIPFGASSLIMSGDFEPVATLYRVSIRPGGRLSPVRVTVTRLLGRADRDQKDRFQPAVSQDGTRLAYIVRPNGGKYRHSQLWVRDLETRSNRMVTEYAHQTGDKKVAAGIQFPAWYYNLILMWPNTTGEVETDEENPGGSFNRIDYAWALGGSPPVVSSSYPIVGPGTKTPLRLPLSGAAEEDVKQASFEDPEYAALGSERYGATRAVVFQSNYELEQERNIDGDDDLESVTQVVPIVGRLFGNGTYLNFERVNLGNHQEFVKARLIETGQHPFWMDSGELIAHEGPPMYWDRDNDVMTRWEMSYSFVADYTWGPTSAPDPLDSGALSTPAYSPPEPADFYEFFAAASAQAGFDDGGGVYESGQVGAKYGKGVPGSEYIVTTMFRMAPLGYSMRSTKGWSRVVLIRRSDGQMWDLTTLVEAREGAVEGSYSSFAPHAVARDD